MKTAIRLVSAAALVIALVVPALADDAYNGVLLCAKCALNKPDAHECQDVLIVTDAKGAKTEYYIVKNDVAEKSGEACTQEIKATVTGSVAETDGRKWLTPSKIEKH